MCLVKFINEDIEIEVDKGSTLVECIRKACLKIETPCTGKGNCGKCKVETYGILSDKTKEEKELTQDDFIRLACMTKVKGDVQIKLIKKLSTLKTINKGVSIDTKLDSSIKKVELSPVTSKNYIPYEKRIDYKVDNLSIFKKIGQAEQNKYEMIYGVVFKQTILNIAPKSEKILGVAVDIGTTGISTYLIDLEKGQVLNMVSALNPQTEYGNDVLSRITFSMKQDDGIDVLSKCIRDKINSMITQLIEDKFFARDIYRVIIAANTTMLHLFLGVKPDSIAIAPYRAVFLDEINIKANELDIKINDEGILTLIPSVSSYVGADIVAGIVATDFQNKKHSSVFIDIGTNGEIVAVSNGEMAASSTAAGPAFEGMNISCGMRAEEGAIEGFEIDNDFNVNYSTIGGGKPTGICGSGLLDIVASLVKTKVVLNSGRFNKELAIQLKDRLKDKKFYLTEKIYISQKDIRQVQLAKGAISSGIIMLLKQIGIDIKDIEEVVVAGAFGYHINPDSIKTIGLIPKGFNGEINFVGNSSIEGARIALINEDKLKEMSVIKENIKVVELSTREDFQDYFIGSLNF